MLLHFFPASIKYHKHVGLHIELPGMFPEFKDSGFRIDWDFDTSRTAKMGPKHWADKYYILDWKDTGNAY